jgi:Domain of unknown function (DUF4406)
VPTYRRPWEAYRLYLSGPMTGLPGHNVEAFNAEAHRLRLLGYSVVNPVEVAEGIGPNPTWQSCMRADVKMLAGCDALVLLPGWQESQGAMLEIQLAFQLGLLIREYWEVTRGP